MSGEQREQCYEQLVARVGGCTPRTAERLLAAGLINRRQIEALAIRERIFDYLRTGARCGDAMQWAAEEFHCSYEKVRHLYYQKTETKTL